MKLVVLVVVATVVVASGSVYPIHPGVGAIFKGPNSETIIKGPDGSVITAEAVGGSVSTEIKPEVAAVVPLKSTIVLPETVALPEPNIVATAPVVQENSVISAEHAVSVGPVISAESVASAESVLSAEPVISEEHAIYSSGPAVATVGHDQIITVDGVVDTNSGIIQEHVPVLSGPLRPVQNVPIEIEAVQTVPVVSGAVSFVNNPIIVEGSEVLDEKTHPVVQEPAAVDSASIDGPSGSITTHGQHSVVSGPASTTISDGKNTAEIAKVEPLPNVVPVGHVINQLPLAPIPVQTLQQANYPQLAGAVPKFAAVQADHVGLPVYGHPFYQQAPNRYYK